MAGEGEAERRLTVLFAVHSTHYGGAEILAQETAEFLAGLGHRLTIAAPEGPLYEALARSGVMVKPTPTLPTWGGTAGLWASSVVRVATDVPRLRRVIFDSSTDVVLTNTFTTPAPVLAARLSGIPAVVHAREWPTSRFALALLRLQSRAATTVVGVARPLCVAATDSARDARVVHIPDGVYIDPSVPCRAPPSPRLRLGLVGGVEPRKGQDLAIRALAELRERGVDADLEIVGRHGPPSFERKLDALIVQHDLHDRVHRLGERPDVDRLMQHWDALVLPSRGDWTPLSVMEAMGCGLPVVAASVGELPEMLDHGRCGVLVAPENVEALAGAIARLAADRDSAPAAERLAAARRRVAARYDLLDSLHRLAEELLLASSASAPRASSGGLFGRLARMRGTRDGRQGTAGPGTAACRRSP